MSAHEKTNCSDANPINVTTCPACFEAAARQIDRDFPGALGSNIRVNQADKANEREAQINLLLSNFARACVYGTTEQRIACGDAIKAALPRPAAEAQQWISAEERLPPKNAEVLIALEGMAIPSTGQYTGSPHDHHGWCYPAENGDWDQEGWPRVLYWQPLPDVPGLGPDGNFLQSTQEPKHG